MAEPRRVRHVLSPTGVQPEREWGGLQTIAADPTRSRSVSRACSQLKFLTTEHQVLLTALFLRAPGYRGHFLCFWPKEGSVLVDD